MKLLAVILATIVVVMGDAPPPPSVSVTAVLTAERTDVASPATIHFSATGSSTTISGLDVMQDCQCLWDFGDAGWPSGQGLRPFGTGDPAFHNMNTDGAACWTGHTYEEPVANWAQGDTAGTVKTAQVLVRCAEPDGTYHFDTETVQITVRDPLAAGTEVCVDAFLGGHPDCPAGVTQVNLTLGNDLCAWANGRAERLLIVQEREGVYTCGTKMQLDTDQYLDVVGTGDRKVSLTHNGATLTFVEVSSRSVAAGLVPTTTDADNTHIGFNYATGSQHGSIYRSGASGTESGIIMSGSTNGKKYIDGFDFDMAGISLNTSGGIGIFVSDIGGKHLVLNSRVVREGQFEFAVRYQCAPNESAVRHNDSLDTGRDKNHAWRGCGGVGTDRNSTLGWNLFVQNTDSINTFLVGMRPQNTTSPDERHEQFILEGNIGYAGRDCAGSGGDSPNSLFRNSTRLSTYRHNIFVDDTTGCGNASSRVLHQENLRDDTPTVVPDYDPPSGNTDKDQLGGNFTWSGIVVSEATDRTPSQDTLQDCKVTAGAEEQCGFTQNALFVSDQKDPGSPACSGCIGSNADPDSYFNGYTDATPPEDLHVGLFDRTTPANDGVCNQRSFWRSDMTLHTFPNCPAGVGN